LCCVHVPIYGYIVLCSRTDLWVYCVHVPIYGYIVLCSRIDLWVYCVVFTYRFMGILCCVHVPIYGYIVLCSRTDLWVYCVHVPIYGYIVLCSRTNFIFLNIDNKYQIFWYQFSFHFIIKHVHFMKKNWQLRRMWPSNTKATSLDLRHITTNSCLCIFYLSN